MSFWPGRRVLVTGGGGFLGLASRPHGSSASVRRRSLAPRARDYDLRDPRGRRAVPARTRGPHVVDPRRGLGRRNRGEPRASGEVLLRQRRDGPAPDRGGAPRRRREARRASARSAPIPPTRPCRFARRSSGTATPSRPTRRTGWPRRCCSSSSRRTAQEYGFRGIYLLPVNLYGPGDNFDPETSHVIPALIRKFREAQEAGLAEVVLWGDGSPTREFLHVARRGRGASCLAAERYDGAEPVNLGAGFEISIRDLAAEDRGVDRLSRDDPLGPVSPERPDAAAPRHVARRGRCSASRRASTSRRGCARRWRGGTRCGRSAHERGCGHNAHDEDAAARRATRWILTVFAALGDPLLGCLSAVRQSQRALAARGRRRGRGLGHLRDRLGDPSPGRPRGQVDLRGTPVLQQGSGSGPGGDSRLPAAAAGAIRRPRPPLRSSGSCAR